MAFVHQFTSAAQNTIANVAASILSSLIKEMIKVTKYCIQKKLIISNVASHAFISCVHTESVRRCIIFSKTLPGRDGRQVGGRVRYKG